MNTIKGNKLIADFMGGKISYFRNLPHGRNILIDDLKYHSSWDWLMPVLEKIEETYCTNLSSSFDWDGEKYNKMYSFGIFRNNTRAAPKLSIPNNNKKEAVWLVVVEFINIHNHANETKHFP